MIRIQRVTGLVATLTVLLLTGCAGSDVSRSTGTYLDDTAITAKVEANLAQVLFDRGDPGRNRDLRRGRAIEWICRQPSKSYGPENLPAA